MNKRWFVQSFTDEGEKNIIPDILSFLNSLSATGLKGEDVKINCFTDPRDSWLWVLVFYQADKQLFADTPAAMSFQR